MSAVAIISLASVAVNLFAFAVNLRTERRMRELRKRMEVLT